jgi:glutathione S-transferase
VLIGPFLLRVTHLPKYEDLVPGFLCKALETRAPRFWRWAQVVIAERSVLAVWDEELVVKQSWIKIEKRKRALQ